MYYFDILREYLSKKRLSVKFFYEDTEKSYRAIDEKTTQFLENIQQFRESREDFLTFLFEYTYIIVATAVEAAPKQFYGLLVYAYFEKGHFSENNPYLKNDKLRTAVNAANDLYHCEQHSVLSQYVLSDFEYKVWLSLIEMRIRDLKRMVQYTHADIQNEAQAQEKLIEHISQETARANAYLIWKKSDCHYCLSRIFKKSGRVMHLDFEYNPNGLLVRSKNTMLIKEQDCLIYSSVEGFLSAELMAGAANGIAATIEPENELYAIATEAQL